MNKKILIVDDSSSIRALLRFHLTGAGYTVEEASDGEEAKEKLLKIPDFRLVITDLHMPRMNGLELIEWARQQPGYRFTPILFLTTETNVDMKGRSRKAGATGWIVKPFEPARVLRTIKKVIR